MIEVRPKRPGVKYLFGKPIGEEIEPTRAERLAEYEDRMERGETMYLEAMKGIYDSGVWDASKCSSFAEYCRKERKMSRQRVHQILGAIATKQYLLEDIKESDGPEVREAAEKLNERQSGTLKTVPREQRVAVLKAAVKAGKVTSTTIGAVIKAKKPKPDDKEAEIVGAKVCPHCGHSLE